MSDTHVRPAGRVDVLVIGAGASGLMCAIEAGKRGRDVVVLEKGRKAGRKILIAGGGRCNFTNLYADPRKTFHSRNPHFCISALQRYRPEEFIRLVDAHQIPWHEKKLGQLFCDRTSQDILDMLLAESAAAGISIRYDHEAVRMERLPDGGFRLHCINETILEATVVVIACGGLSIPNLVSDFAFSCARDLGLTIVPPRPGLVPFTSNEQDKALLSPLSGISLDAIVSLGAQRFRENILITHRGLSGPAILQISSYWHDGETISINLLPEEDAPALFRQARAAEGAVTVKRFLMHYFPKRFVEQVTGNWFPDKPLGQLSNAEVDAIAGHFGNWQYKPGGTEGYRTAEVTVGGISTDELSSRTFECRSIPNLYVIGEAVDVTGWLGGYNFQWAWASAWCAAQNM